MSKFFYSVSLSVFVMLISVVSLSAQQEEIPFDDLPPTAEYGKCYAKCRQPDVYENVTASVLVKEASTKFINVPAVYETKYEKVLVKQGAKTYQVIPAKYKTVTEKVLVTPEKRVLKTVPAQYNTESKRVLVSEARGEWVKKKKEPNCFSENPEDCFIVCWEEIPAVYRTETSQILVQPAKTVEEIIPAVYKTVESQVIAEEARTIEVPIEPVYETVATKVLVSPERTEEEKIPAVYRDVQERKLVSKGGYTVWTEILCASKTTTSTVQDVQRALKARGYDPGPIDGILGLKTQTALRQFQNDNKLPIGNLNIKTLQALGLKSI